MKTQRISAKGILGLGLATVMGLALAAQPGLSGAAHATDEEVAGSPASEALAAKPSASYSIKGRFFNSSPTIDCRDVDDTQICSYKMSGQSLTDDGEPYRHTIIGTSFGRATMPGDESRHQSYVVRTFDDGSMVLMKSRGKTTVDANGQRTVSGRQVCLDGIGRFENVDCSIDWSHAGHNDGRTGGNYEGTVTPKESL